MLLSNTTVDHVYLNDISCPFPPDNDETASPKQLNIFILYPEKNSISYLESN